MKKSLLILLILGVFETSAQVKIGENPSLIDANSILELQSSSKALVITRLTTIEMEALKPLAGALIYNEDESCIFYYNGTAWNNLCNGEGEGSIRAPVWGDITGVIADQVDLAGELAKNVNLTTMQTIGGEKTFTNKLTVTTGDTNDQAAEFLGRVKGEDGIAAEDFVTKAQLDASGGGHTGNEGSVFFAGVNTQPTEDNSNLYWDNTQKQLRVGAFIDLIDKFQVFSDDSTTLNIQGSISKPVHQATTLTEEHHTIIISWSTFITLPDPAECFGRIYIIKIRPGITVGIRGFAGYNDSASVKQREFPSGKVTQLQSNGYAWEQIN